MSKKPNADEISSLSDYDVQLLHNIVSLAEESDDPPFRALFAAYDKTLAEYGIQADHDRIYFRFLLRMGEAQTAGNSLFERFEGLLWKMGIEVAFGDEDVAVQNISSDETLEDETDRNFGRIEDKQLNATPSRRSSFDDVQEYEERQRSQQRLQSKHARSLSFDDLSQLRVEEDIQSPPRRQRAHRKPTGLPDRRLRGQVVEQRQLVGSQVTRGQQRLQRQEQDAVSDSDSSDFEDDVSQPTDVIHPQTQIANPTKTGRTGQNLDANAKTLRYHHLAAQAIKLFQLWSSSANVKRHEHEQMLLEAVAKDKETLCRQALDQWKTRLQAKRREHETEMFYHRLEQKAQAARDLFLLSKAFTHWAELTNEEVARTSAAKRFILRNRYFNAWRDVTVVNELKVRRQGLMKFWKTWRARTRRVRESESSADSFRDLSIAEKCYRRWFWTFCEHRAPIWYESRIKSNAFSSWLEGTRQNAVRERLAGELNEFQLIRKFAIQWINRSAIVHQNEQEAQAFRQRIMMLRVVDWLRKELELVPVEAQVSRLVKFRTLKTAMRTWVDRSRMYRKAASIDKLRLKRNSWTCWNDRLRCQTLANSIDERVVLNALYKWVIAERLALFQRVAKDNLRARIFAQWRTKTDELTQSLSAPYHLVRSLSTCNATRAILRQWNISSDGLDSLREEAEQFRYETCTVNAIRAWVTRYENVTNLEGWANDALFYTTTNRALKLWRAGTIASQKAKRREAFAFFRRKTKMNLARKSLFSWQSATNRLKELREQAEELDSQHIQQVYESTFYTWQETCAAIDRDYSQAKMFDEHRLLRRHWDIYVLRNEAVSKQHITASEYLGVSVDSSASKALRQMTWRVFQLRGQHELADSLRSRTSKKHYRNMLRYWAESTRQRRTNDANPVVANATLIEEQTMIDEWPEVEDSILADRSRLPQNVVSTPGYLRTPARRVAVRNSTLVRLPRTPATTQLTPQRPFSRLPFSRSRVPQSARSNFVRRLVDSGNTHVDSILETSPIRGDEY